MDFGQFFLGDENRLRQLVCTLKCAKALVLEVESGRYDRRNDGERDG